MKLKKALRRPWAWVAVLVVIALAIALQARSGDEEREELDYSRLVTALNEDRVESVTDKVRDHVIAGELADGTEFETAYNPDVGGSELANALEAARERGSLDTQAADAQTGNQALMVLLQALPFVLILGLFVFLMMSMQGGGRLASFGKSKAKAVTKDSPTVTFADVAGADEAVEDLREIRDFLSEPGRFTGIGASIPKGVLLLGPPGTGKTLLARAVAGEAGVPFFAISGSDFVEMFVGVGASRVRDLFNQAKDSAPAIVFVDEIDAVGRHRGAGMGGGHDEREQTLNQLLVEMDGFDSRTGVMLIAATNRPDILDPALLRPGRFDRQIAVDQPDVVGRTAILEVHAKGKPVDAHANLEVIARRTPGFTGADLSNLVNEAALLSARRGETEISMASLEAAIDRVIAGPERRTRLIDDDQKRVIAYHEGGHTIVGHALPHADPIHKVSIIPRGRALGWTLSLPTEDKYLVARGELIDRLAMMLGGRVAEELTIGDFTTGAADDIEKATATARDMVTHYGMSARLGPLRVGRDSQQPFMGREYGHGPDYSDEVAREIDREVRALVDEAHDEALEILVANRAVLEELADSLVGGETVEGEALGALLDRVVQRPSRKIEPLMNGDGQHPDGSTVVSRLRRAAAPHQRAPAETQPREGPEPPRP
jgi:cell division protease FtsH